MSHRSSFLHVACLIVLLFTNSKAKFFLRLQPQSAPRASSPASCSINLNRVAKVARVLCFQPKLTKSSAVSSESDLA